MNTKDAPQKNPEKQARTSRRPAKAQARKQKTAPAKKSAMQLAAELIWANPKDGQKVARQLLAACLSNTQELVRNLQAQNDQDTVQASFALEAMAMMASAPGQESKRKSMAKALQQSLAEARDAVAKEIIISYLQRIGSDESISTLGKILASGDDDAFAPALLALQHIGDYAATREIYRCLPKVSPERQVLLTVALLSEEQCEPAYLNRAIKVWQEPANQDNPLLWLALSQQGHSEIMPYLLAALQSESKVLAIFARASLLLLAYNCESEEQLEHILIELMCQEPRRASTWYALRKYDIDNPETVWQLMVLLWDENPALRQVAFDFFCKVSHEVFITDVLIKYCMELQDSMNDEKYFAARLALIEILGQSRANSARPYLMSLLHDPEVSIRRAALAAVEKLCGPLPNKVLAAIVQL